MLNSVGICFISVLVQFPDNTKKEIIINKNAIVAIEDCFVSCSRVAITPHPDMPHYFESPWDAKTILEQPCK